MLWYILCYTFFQKQKWVHIFLNHFFLKENVKHYFVEFQQPFRQNLTHLTIHSYSDYNTLSE